MDQIQEVKHELNARSKATTVEELQRRGRKQVKILKADDIAGLISESVQRTIEKSDLLSQEEVDRLVSQSRDEFRQVVAERQRDAAESREIQEELERAQGALQQTKQEANELRGELDQSNQRAQDLRSALEDAQRGLEEAQSAADEARQAAEAAAAEAKQAQGALAQAREAQDAGPSADSAAPDGMNAEIMFRLMNELAEMKAAMAQGPAPAAAAGGADVSDAIQQLAGTLNERLEKFGRKIGISTAVDAADVKFDGLFKDEGPELESNMSDVKVTKRTGSGIAGNLEKLKKLKGGG